MLQGHSAANKESLSQSKIKIKITTNTYQENSAQFASTVEN